MPKVTYVDPDGTELEVDADAGTSVMMAAVNADIDGIVAECGGSLMCATCHVYVDHGSPVTLPAVSDIEDELLYTTACPRRENSRLSCQLPVTDAIDGLVVDVPERQV